MVLQGMAGPMISNALYGAHSPLSVSGFFAGGIRVRRLVGVPDQNFICQPLAQDKALAVSRYHQLPVGVMRDNFNKITGSH